MERIDVIQRLAAADRVLVGLGEEWRLEPEADAARREKLMAAYDALYELLKEKNYFIITMATDDRIGESRLGSRDEHMFWEEPPEEMLSCPADEETAARMDRIFPPKARLFDTRSRRIVAPCAGMVPAHWDYYIRWLADSWKGELLILELGVGFDDPGVIRFPFEQTAIFNQRAFLVRVHARFSQITEELSGRAEGIAQSSLDFILP